MHPSAASAERGAGEAPRWEGACFRGQEGLQLSEGWGGQTARPQSLFTYNFQKPYYGTPIIALNFYIQD